MTYIEIKNMYRNNEITRDEAVKLVEEHLYSGRADAHSMAKDVVLKWDYLFK